MADVRSGSASVPSGAQMNSNTEDSNRPTKEESNPPPEEEAKQASEEPNFECNICLDTAKDAVVSMCGHLFCWPCLHQWLETRPNRQICPVCKAAISREKVIPLYGRGGGKQQDPRDKLPPRPQAQRTEPEPGGGFPNFGFNDGGFQMSFGIGGFPFGLFTSSFSWGDFARTPAAHGSAHLVDEDRFLSQIFLWVALLFIVWLFIA